MCIGAEDVQSCHSVCMALCRRRRGLALRLHALVLVLGLDFVFKDPGITRLNLLVIILAIHSVEIGRAHV